MARHNPITLERRQEMAADWATRSQKEWGAYFGCSPDMVGRAAKAMGLPKRTWGKGRTRIWKPTPKQEIVTLGIHFDHSHPVPTVQRCQGSCGQRYRVTQGPHVCNGTRVPVLPWEGCV